MLGESVCVLVSLCMRVSKCRGHAYACLFVCLFSFENIWQKFRIQDYHQRRPLLHPRESGLAHVQHECESTARAHAGDKDVKVQVYLQIVYSIPSRAKVALLHFLMCLWGGCWWPSAIPAARQLLLESNYHHTAPLPSFSDNPAPHTVEAVALLYKARSQMLNFQSSVG